MASKMGDAEQPQKFKMCILKINAFKEKKILFYKTFSKMSNIYGLKIKLNKI